MYVELWSDIKGFEGKYKISNKGHVMSLDYNNTGKPELMKPRINKKGYYTVNLWKDNKAHQFAVGLLVGRHFLKQEENNLVLIHLGDKLNDEVENLKFVTRSEARYKEHQIENKSRRIKYKFSRKQYKKLKIIAASNGISAHRMYERLYQGWTIEEAISIPIERKEKILNARLYDFYGKFLSIKQISEKNNINAKAIYKRLARGWGIEEAAEIPLAKTNEWRKKKCQK